ncbi:hypothetical protein HMPREF9418_1693 [Neisseria macacae ATCC 33926]|uniref:Uncharacterized protein n=1 Tax=Neisseria macacae ATCC 33926 TaxID=997348 RepID=A0AA36UIM6_9NEIS|nr:hypothetical protein HMPREF9418_1693 [Neisseria macacae ATCC 33926]
MRSATGVQCLGVRVSFKRSQLLILASSSGEGGVYELLSDGLSYDELLYDELLGE